MQYILALLQKKSTHRHCLTKYVSITWDMPRKYENNVCTNKMCLPFALLARFTPILSCFNAKSWYFGMPIERHETQYASLVVIRTKGLGLEGIRYCDNKICFSNYFDFVQVVLKANLSYTITMHGSPSQDCLLPLYMYYPLYTCIRSPFIGDVWLFIYTYLWYSLFW